MARVEADKERLKLVLKLLMLAAAWEEFEKAFPGAAEHV